MRPTRSIAVVASAALLVTLTACTEPDVLIDGSHVTVELPAPVTSLNPETRFGNTELNRSLAAVTGAGFFAYDEHAELVADESFGTVEVVNDDPFAVRYTIADGVTWSDGVPIDAADLLLAWAGNSGHLNTDEFDDAAYVDDEWRYSQDMPDDVVRFDGASRSGLQFVSTTPIIADDSTAITLVYDRYFSDWQLAFRLGPAAHVLAADALGLDGAAEAKAAVTKAIVDELDRDLAPLSRAWNSALNVSPEGTPPASDYFISSGPYTITAWTNASLELTANPLYTGDRQPRYETLELVVGGDPIDSIERLRTGQVDVVAPQATVEIMDALRDLTDVVVVTSDEAQFEHLDFRFAESRNGDIENPLVRQALLAVLPRAQLAEDQLAHVHDDVATRDSFVFMPAEAGYADAVESNGSHRYARPSAAEARRLLEEAGIASPTVCVLFDSSNSKRRAQFETMRDTAAPAGFRLTDCSRADWIDVLGDPRMYDAALFSWRSTNVGVTGLASRLHSTQGVTNFSFYSNPDVDALLEQLENERDTDERTSLLAEIDGHLWEDAYGAPLYQHPLVVAHSSTLSGVAPSPLPPHVLWNVNAWEPAPADPDD